MIFGRRSGPMRFVLAIVVVGVLALLAVTVARLNERLDNQEAANQETLRASQAIVSVNDRVTYRLRQLTELTKNADQALKETKGLEPLLVALQDAVAPAAAAIEKGREGGEASEAQLVKIEAVVNQVEGRTGALVKDAQAFGAQGVELLRIVRALVADIESALAATKRVNDSLPG
ncbi:hypothetical protein [Haloechinothrix salitolerans]|uniref:Methyl-accepting chemotaxis protein n=1 Tax=Haloechinothrix salitolerans TaxID=926830 RepID=A0ABW2C6E3_9PSEU